MKKALLKEMEAFVKKATEGPRNSASAIMVWDGTEGETRPEFIVQMGYLLFHPEKPIIIMATEGQEIPARVLKVADAIVRYRLDDPEGAAAAMTQALKDLGVVQTKKGADESAP